MLNPLENMGEKGLKTDRTPQNDCSVASASKTAEQRDGPAASVSQLWDLSTLGVDELMTSL